MSQTFPLREDFLALRNAATALAPTGRSIVLHLEPLDPNRPAEHPKAIQLLLTPSQAEGLVTLLQDALEQVS